MRRSYRDHPIRNLFDQTSPVIGKRKPSQALTKRYLTPFGKDRGTPLNGPWPDDKSFLGKSADTDTGLTHIGAREYDPRIGQFVSVDPVLDAADGQSLNGYSYADNNPATSADPTGLCAGPDCLTRNCPSCINGTPTDPDSMQRAAADYYGSGSTPTNHESGGAGGGGTGGSGGGSGTGGGGGGGFWGWLGDVGTTIVDQAKTSVISLVEA